MLLKRSRPGAILILCHARTEHLIKVLESIKLASTVQEWDIVICAQDPTTEVLQIIKNTKLQNLYVEVRSLKEKDFSVKKCINSNLFWGMNHIFNVLGKEYVVVLEDDVVISPSFLEYMCYFLTRFQKSRSFRGVNSVSSFVGDQNENSFGKYSQGLMWGWGITNRVFQKLEKFWTGEEDAHWDYYLEPFLRTGFVINPMYSQVKNIGFDSTASHTKDAPELENAINESFRKGLTLKPNKWRESEIDFRMRKDYLHLSRRKLIRNFLVLGGMYMSFTFYFAGIKTYGYLHYLSRRIRIAIVH